ncbi:MAG: PqqD family protein [Bacteroidales bacterium]
MRIKKGFTLRSVGNERIVVGEGLEQIDFNKLIALNSAAAYLWESVEGKGFDECTLADLLMTKYDLPKAQAGADAHEIAQAWISIGIVEE